MESDIVERLRDNAAIDDYDPAKLQSESRILREAADEIERLRADLAAMSEKEDIVKRSNRILWMKLQGDAVRDALSDCVGEIKRLRAEASDMQRQRDEARELNKSWEQKAATWLATPEAIARLQSYRDLGQQVAKAHSEIDRLRAELAAAIKQRDEAQRWLRDACAEIARIEARFYDALTPQQIAERNGWNCFGEKEGGGA